MAKVEIELDRAGVREFLRSEDMQNVVSAEASVIMQTVGAGYSANTRQGRNRAIARVSASSDETVRDNYENNTLLKAVGG